MYTRTAKNTITIDLHFADYIKSCACMEVCRQVVLTMDVSFEIKTNRSII